MDQAETDKASVNHITITIGGASALLMAVYAIVTTVGAIYVASTSRADFNSYRYEIKQYQAEIEQLNDALDTAELEIKLLKEQ